MYRTPSGVFCVILETEYEKEEYYEPRYLEGDNLKETGATYSAICSRNLLEPERLAGTISALCTYRFS